MPTAQAVKKCPDLILLPVNMPLYKQVSDQIHQIFRRYTDIIEPLSLDEAYLDVTDSNKCSGSATWIATEIRQAIWQELGLTASAGVAPLKFLAKIASDINKPNGQYVIQPHQVEAFLHTLALDKIPGVGKVTNQRLQHLGLTTCGDVQSADLALLIRHFGKIGKHIWDFSQGIDERVVIPERKRKSIGIEETLIENIQQFTEGIQVLKRLYPKLQQRIHRAYPEIPLGEFRKLGIKLKFDDFQVTTLEKSAVAFSEENFIKMLQDIWARGKGRSVRLIGLHTIVPLKQDSNQMSLW